MERSNYRQFPRVNLWPRVNTRFVTGERRLGNGPCDVHTTADTTATGPTTVYAARRSAASAAQRQRPIIAAPCQWPPIGQIDSAARCTPYRPLLSSLTLRPLLLRLLDGRRNRMLGTVPQPDTFTNRIECFPLFLLAISPSESISFFRQISRLRTILT